MSKVTVRQYSTDDHDSQTITLGEYKKLNKDSKARIKKSNKMIDCRKIYMHQSTYAGVGERVW
jgi:hypothetical protein